METGKGGRDGPSAHQAVSVRSFEDWMRLGSGTRQRYRKSSRRSRGGDGGVDDGSVDIAKSPRAQARRELVPPKHLRHKARADFFGRVIGVAVPTVLLGTLALSVLVTPDASLSSEAGFGMDAAWGGGAR